MGGSQGRAEAGVIGFAGHFFLVWIPECCRGGIAGDEVQVDLVCVCVCVCRMLGKGGRRSKVSSGVTITKNVFMHKFSLGKPCTYTVFPEKTCA